MKYLNLLKIKMPTEYSQINIGEYVIDIYKKNIKNMHLAVYPPTGRIRISAPFSTDVESIRLFAISKLSWIKKHQDNFISQPRLPKPEYKTGESHYYLGKRFLLDVKKAAGKQRVHIKNKKYIVLEVKNIDSYDSKERELIKWYRSELGKIIPSMIANWEKKLGVHINEWRVRRMKTRWGSCNIKAKRILLNLELIKKSIDCVEYVLVHEMVHLLERLHNDNFEGYMNRFIPKWKSYKKEINQFPIQL